MQAIRGSSDAPVDVFNDVFKLERDSPASGPRPFQPNVFMHALKFQSQRGQALPLGIFLLLAAIVVMYFMFNSGQVTSEKMRITNTADAVAYSAGVYQARVLNYDAFTNRAMIANEVAIGQAVSLASWDEFIQPMYDRLEPYTTIYPIGWVVEVIRSILEGVATAAEVASYSSKTAVNLHGSALRLLAASQAAMHGPGNSVLAKDRLKVMQEIARRNDPDIEVDPLPLDDNFLGLTHRYESRDERKRMAELVKGSMDGFMTDRGWAKDPVPLPEVLGCKIGPELRRRGGTQFIDVDGWKAMDTFSIHMLGVRVRRLRITCTDVEDPIGYGTAVSSKDLDDSGLDYGQDKEGRTPSSRGSRHVNPHASSQADSSASSALPTIFSAEIPAFYELAPEWISGANADKEPRVELAIRVFKSKGKQRFSGGNSTIRPAGQLALYQGAHQGDQTAAVSRVEVFFERPDGKNPKKDQFERASLFNPYWQVRLMSKESDRATAAARQGVSSWPF